MSGNNNPIEESTNESSKLKLNIQAQDGSIVCYEVKPNTLMRKIFEAYSNKKQMTDYRVFRFLYHSKRIRSEKTVKEVGLKNGSKIDAMLFQNGGGPAH
ncbi:Small ubiquitin- modifier 1 [Datura stramonium]|uniref:Small ubiquitin- modifier 1 n=1 Tax=Datura stramonium TaxID=4076 RepID=A0ABS8RXB1_DATST|nr:Small ubiquitin- modifier 1 [Datura stramonium]